MGRVSRIASDGACKHASLERGTGRKARRR